MPNETQDAVNYSLQQIIDIPEMGITYPITKDTPQELVDKVREYFNDNNIEYQTFNYNDLIPYLPS